ncbi:MAG: hypothetical protein ACLGH4_00010 [Actinomycetes bacterium]
MTRLLLLLDPDTEIPLGPGSHRRLTALGVTQLTVLQDDRSLGVVLEGWTFDPSRSLDRLLEQIGASGDVRVLRQLIHVAVDATTRETA